MTFQTISVHVGSNTSQLARNRIDSVVKSLEDFDVKATDPKHKLALRLPAHGHMSAKRNVMKLTKSKVQPLIGFLRKLQSGEYDDRVTEDAKLFWFSKEQQFGLVSSEMREGN